MTKVNLQWHPAFFAEMQIELAEEVTGMCEALERIYLEVNGERLARERKEELDKAVAEAVEVAVAEAKQTLAEQAAYIKELEAKLAMQNA